MSAPRAAPPPEPDVTDAQRALVASVAEAAERPTLPPAARERYACAQALVLDQGRAWTPVPLGADLEPHRGVPGGCYTFAARLADAVPGLVYVEGYACPQSGAGWAIPHAWVGRLADGAALDPTWSAPGTAYYGVPLTAPFRRSAPRAPGTAALLVEMLPRDVRRHGLPPGAVAR
ncbi:hypothetical protein ABZ234_08320 [Nocardiopsis sp. NPDC006198]|uniref:hypothetical protein n=1 Tax=Nocardiopsis sp. NPDC006198 TaxID=3154472 RepID=UPI0033AF847A